MGPRIALLASLFALAAFALTASVARASAYVHLTEKSFPFPGLPQGSGPKAIAINQSTGELYVSAPYSPHVVDAFEASGAPDPVHPTLTEANGTTGYPFAFPTSVAVDNSGGTTEGDIYVNDEETILQFDPSGARTAQAPIAGATVPAAGTSQASLGLPPIENNGGFSPSGLAVASNGDVYVADASNDVIDVFEADGDFVSQLAAGHLSYPGEISLDPSNDLYVSQPYVGLVEFNPSGACVASCNPLGPVSSVAVATDSEGNVYSDHSDYKGALINELNSSGEWLENFGFATLKRGTGVAVNDASGTVYVGDFASQDVKLFERTPPPSLPTVDATSASNLTPNTAALAAQINPGSGTTDYRFQYGTGTSYGSSTPIVELAGSDQTDHLATATISGLAPSTLYHFRAVAINFTGTGHGPDQTFTTPGPPAVNGANVTNVTSSTAELEAAVNPKLAATTYHFQYGTDTSYGSTTPESISIGSDNVSHDVTADLSGLAPTTTYHFRIVATNPFGTVPGLDQTFTTAAPPSDRSPLPRSCKAGYVLKRGRCVRKPHPKSKHHKRGGRR